MRVVALAAVFCVAIASKETETSSPILKIIELLDGCAAKTKKNLAAESKEMEKYTQFCDNEVSDRTYAVDTATRQLEDTGATIEESEAKITALEDESSALGMRISDKNRELDAAITARQHQRKTFGAVEKELLSSIEQLDRGIDAMKAGQTFFLQGRGRDQLEIATQGLAAIINTAAVDTDSQEKLSSLLQDLTVGLKQFPVSEEVDDDRELVLTQQMMHQPQAPARSLQSQGGGIIATMSEMLDKAENALSDTRKKEVGDQHAFDLMKQGLEGEISHSKEKMATANSNKAQSQMDLEEVNLKQGDTEKSKAADVEYLNNLKTDCQQKAVEWEERMRSANGELAAIAKAKEILEAGVNVFLQVRASTRRESEIDASNTQSPVRKQLVDSMQDLASQHHSLALNQIAVAALTDPFLKVKGMINDMLSKLKKEAEEAATKEAVCQEQMAKNRKEHKDKSAKLDKHKTRMDEAGTTIATTMESIKALEAEIASTINAQKEATELRRQEHATYLQSSGDYRQAAEAVASAIEVLKSYYEGASFLQVSKASGAQRYARQSSITGSQSSAGGTIISILDMAQEDFTTMLAEIEGAESEAEKVYKKLSNENEITKATKEAEVKGKKSEVTSLKLQLEHSTEDYESISGELDTVTAYMDKLKPQCEQKGETYAERKSSREQEIKGLQNGLAIVSGEGLSLISERSSVRRMRLRAPHLAEKRTPRGNQIVSQ